MVRKMNVASPTVWFFYHGKPNDSELIFSRILSVPKRRIPIRNFGSPNQIREKKEMTNHDRLFGATKIPFGGPPFGDTQNPREKLIPSHLEFYESRFALN